MNAEVDTRAAASPPGELDIEEISAVNLTKLSWDQPLVASVRILLACGRVPSYALVTADDVPYDDGEIRQFLSDVDGTAVDGVGEDVPSVLARKLPDGDHDFLTDVRSYHRAFADALYAALPSRSRAGAVMSVLFTELGWQVRTIAQILGVSRPTVNKWVMTHVSEPVSASEEAAIVAAAAAPCTGSDADGTAGMALLDVRTTEFRTRRSGLSWKKLVALPSPEIATVMRALWRVSYRSRGSKSTLEEQVCSWTLDLMLDLLMRRGMTAQNLSACMGVTHRAVFARFERSASVGEEAPESRAWAPASEIARPVRCFVPKHLELPEQDSWLQADARLVQRTSVSHRVGKRGTGGDVLLHSRTHAATETNQSPVVNTYALTSPATVDSETLNKLVELDTCAPSEVLDVIAAAAGSSGFVPLRASSDREALAAQCDTLLQRLRGADDGRDSPVTAALQDPDLAAAVYGVDRYRYPSVTDRSEWRDGIVLTESLLVQATGQWDRDASLQDGTGRPGFGRSSHHWVPGAAVGQLVDASFRDHSAADIARASADVPEGTDPSAQLAAFLPHAVSSAVNRWVSRTTVADGYDRPAEFRGKPLLWVCFHDPALALRALSGPKLPARAAKRSSSCAPSAAADGSSDRV